MDTLSTTTNNVKMANTNFYATQKQIQSRVLPKHQNELRLLKHSLIHIMQKEEVSRAENKFFLKYFKILI